MMVGPEFEAQVKWECLPLSAEFSLGSHVHFLTGAAEVTQMEAVIFPNLF